MGERGYLSPAEIEEIRKVAGAVNDPVGAVLGALLGHIDAITPKAVDAETIGRWLWEKLVAWFPHGLLPLLSDVMAAAVHLYDLGHVAGVISREEDRARADEATRASMANMIEAKNLAQRTAEDAHREIDRITVERDQFAKRADFFQGEHRSALDEVKVLCDEREKSTALIATLRELLKEREWDPEDHSCRTCGAILRHGEPLEHKPDCALDAALLGDK